MPQLRPIEDLWGIAKQEVYKGGWTPTSEQQLESRIRKALLSIDAELPRRMIEGVWWRVRLAAKRGASSALY